MAHWPKEPYKGLQYYDAADAPLFVGREVEIESCIVRLTEPRTRTLILHGQSGAGKSSFLRAGLIPALEESSDGWMFLKPSPGKSPTFIRCTAQPMMRLAEALFEFTGVKWEVKTAKGIQIVDLEPTRGGCDTLERFVGLCSDAHVVVGILDEISSLLHQTLVVIIDQAEEVVTLKDADEGPFSEFIKLFSTSSIDAKLILSLRTENFGEFFRLLNFDGSIFADAKQFLLSPLNRDALRTAILLPTLTAPQGDLPPPSKEYRFEFKPGEDGSFEVVELMLDDLFKFDPRGGVLPAMQVACRDMYNEVRRGPEPWIITPDLYQTGDGIAGRINKYISQALHLAFAQAGIADQSRYEALEQNWRYALSGMALVAPDGTARTDYISEADLVARLHDNRAEENVAACLFALTRGDSFVLRPLEISSGGAVKQMYSLAHDSLALALDQWQIEERARKEEVRKRRRMEAAHEAERRNSLIRLFVGVGITAIIGVIAWLILSRAAQQDSQFAERGDELQTLVELNFYKDIQRTAVGLAASLQYFRHDSTKWITPDRIKPLAVLISELPSQAVSLPQRSPSNYMYALSLSKRFIFWSSTRGLDLISWAGPEHDTVSPSELMQFLHAGDQAIQLRRATEVAPDKFLLRFERAGAGAGVVVGWVSAVRERTGLKLVRAFNLADLQVRSALTTWNPPCPPGREQSWLVNQDANIVFLEKGYHGCSIRLQAFFFNWATQEFDAGAMPPPSTLSYASLVGGWTTTRIHTAPPGIVLMSNVDYFKVFYAGLRPVTAWDVRGAEPSLVWSRSIDDCSSPKGFSWCDFGIQYHNLYSDLSYTWVRMHPTSNDSTTKVLSRLVLGTPVPASNQFMLIDNKTGKDSRFSRDVLGDYLNKHAQTRDYGADQIPSDLTEPVFFGGSFASPALGVVESSASTSDASDDLTVPAFSRIMMLRLRLILIAHQRRHEVTDLENYVMPGDVDLASLQFSPSGTEITATSTAHSTGYVWDITQSVETKAGNWRPDRIDELIGRVCALRIDPETWKNFEKYWSMQSKNVIPSSEFNNFCPAATGGIGGGH